MLDEGTKIETFLSADLQVASADLQELLKARRRVHEVLTRTREAGGRCVLVIHGRGNRSEGGAVLKEALLEWLAEAPVVSQVLAFSSATGGHGGVGATYVLLRK